MYLGDIAIHGRVLRMLGKGYKERLVYNPAGAWQRLQNLIDEVRKENLGPLLTRICCFIEIRGVSLPR